MAGDGAAAFDFYAAQFGWTLAETLDMGEMGQYRIFATGGDKAGGIMTNPAQSPAPPHWRFYFGVDVIDAAKSRIETAGGQVLMGPHEVPGGAWIVQAFDPQGALFAVVGPKAGA
jgi:predicted enzyme related to lactoylglutathione lyase